MSSFGRWFNLPRKRSNSTPTRQVLSEFLNKSAIEPFLQPQSQQYSYHKVSSSAGYSSLPTKNTKPANVLNATHSTPLLITSSFYDLAYPFEPCDSPEDETPPEVRGVDTFTNSRPLTLPSMTTDIKPQQHHELNSNNKNKQQQVTQYIQPPLSHQPLSNNVHYMRLEKDYEQDDTLSYYPRESQPITWHIKTSPRKIPSNKDGHPAIKRRPTPFADQKSGYHSYDEEESEIVFENFYHGGIENTSAMDDHQINRTNGKTFNNDTYKAEVRKLKTEIKRLEKKHKEHERHMLDTQQQLEYLIISRSYESTFFGCGSSGAAPHYPYNDNELWKSPPPSKNDIHHYHSQSLNEQQQHSNYWYTPYDMDYYYINHTPNNSYSNKNSSFHHPSSSSSKSKAYDYFTLPKNSSESIKNKSSNSAPNSSCSNSRYDKNDNSNTYPYGYRPPSYASSSSAIDDEKYYYQLQQQHQLLYQNQHFEHPGTNLLNKKENKKRWTQ